MKHDYVKLVAKGRLDDISKGRKRTRIFLTDKNGVSCDDMRSLLVLGAKPTTEQGQRLMIEHEMEHQEKGTLCFDPNDALSMHLDSDDPEIKQDIENIFGPCSWP